MKYTEQVVAFSVMGDTSLGIVAIPEKLHTTAVLIVVGGPQYRIGSHRQFLLLSRTLAKAGYPTMRFDFRGMGDSTGELRNFEAVNQDIRAAIDALMTNCPQVERIVLWSLCDAASASLIYWDATRDDRVVGMVLLNPWVRSEASLAKTHIKHYYGQRLLQVDFWHRLLTGRFEVGRALAGLIGSVKKARQPHNGLLEDETISFQKKMVRGLRSFQGQVLIVLSGNDLTAKEFIETVQSDPDWASCLKQANIQQADVPEADHTFSSINWRTQLENLTKQWVDARVVQ